MEKMMKLSANKHLSPPLSNGGSVKELFLEHSNERDITHVDAEIAEYALIGTEYVIVSLDHCTSLDD